MSEVIEVKVVRVPGAVKDVMLNDGATVADALSAAGITLESGEAAKVNGSDVDSTTTLSNGDRVILAKAAKGNH